MYTKENLYVNVHANIIYHTQKVGIIDVHQDKQNIVSPYNGILLRYKQEWSTDTCLSMDDPWKLYVKWKTPDTKGHLLYDSIHMKCPE